MPAERIFSSREAMWGWWKITEGEDDLALRVPCDPISDAIKNPNKRREFLAGRVLIKTLLEKWNLPYQGIYKDAFGKPYLSGHKMQISLTHSFPYVAAILHTGKSVGIDLEQPKAKLLKIAARVLSPEEQADAGNDITKHCIYWCAKETLVKIYGKKDLVFAENLLISPFSLKPSGYLIGRILANNTETDIPLAYIVSENFVIVVSN